MTLSIALVGDYNEQHNIAHRAIPRSLELGNAALCANITWKWINTAEIPQDVKNSIQDFAGIWVVPGSPYNNMEGVFDVIRYARETGKPFLGTCGGFQHAVIEYARNVCGLQTADHAETNTKGNELVISPLPCSLVGEVGQITCTEGSILHSILGKSSDLEEYYCNYGLNQMYRKQLETAGLHFTGFDGSNNVRAFELPSNPFYIGTLFQPERAALQGKLHPLIKAFMGSL